MNIDLDMLDQLIENRSLLDFKEPVDNQGIILYNCYIEHLLAKVMRGYEPSLIYQPAHCSVICTNPSNGKTVGNLPSRLYELPNTDMPMPLSNEGYYIYSDDLSVTLKAFFDNSCFFDEVEVEILELCDKDAGLCEETAFQKAIANVKASYGYSKEEIEEELLYLDELYEQYLSNKSIQSILWDDCTITDGNLIDEFLESIPDQIQNLFRENAPFLCKAYIVLVFSLLYASTDSAYNGNLSISLWYDASVIKLEELRKAGKLDKAGKKNLEAYEKAVKLMGNPIYYFDPFRHLQEALNHLNDLAPDGTFFLLTGRLDNYSVQQEFYPDPGFQIGAVLAGLLAEEILSEVDFKKAG